MYQNSEFEKAKASKLYNIEEIKSCFDEIDKFYKKINEKFDKCTIKYKTTVRSILDSFPIVNKVDLDGNTLFYINGQLVNDKFKIIEEVEKYISKFESIEYLGFLSEEKRNVVFVGANGCGKTTLLRKLQKDTTDAKIQYYQADRVLLLTNNFNPKRDYDSFENDLKTNYYHATDIEYDFQGRAIEDQFNYYINLLERERNEENEKRIENGLTEQIIKEWSNLVKDRELYFKHGLKVRTSEGITYSLKYLSSGEKSILFFLIGVLLTEDKEYYFVDEPENNLNPAIVSMLWDFIERHKPKSIFVYLTHDSNFVTSRINAKIYWIEKYNGKKWFWKELKEDTLLPQKLLVELVGNRSPVIFCESHDNSQYDVKLFKILFSDYKVIPVAGCDKVCELTKAYKRLQLPNVAYGIIDCDYKDENWLNELEKDNVFHIPFHEIENFLCCEEFIKLVLAEHYNEEEDKVNMLNNLKEKILNIFIENKEKFATHYTAFELRDKFNYRGKINSLRNLQEFKGLYNTEKLTNEKIDEVYARHIAFYEQIVKNDNYNEFLRYLDCKGIISEIEKILKFGTDYNYETELFDLLNSSKGGKIIEKFREQIIKTNKNIA